MTAAAPRLGRAMLRAGFFAWPVWLASLGVLAGAYAGGPFVTLWRITHALESGDRDTLQAVIAWESVRQGLKDDISEGLLGMPQSRQVASNALPPFGASFISGIAATAIDRDVTAQGLLGVARLLDPGPAPGGAGAVPSIVGAGFATPTCFDLRVLAPGQAPDETPLHVRLEFHQGSWQVMRVWIPQDLMDRAAART